MLYSHEPESRLRRAFELATRPFRRGADAAAHALWLVERAIRAVFGFFLQGTEKVGELGDVVQRPLGWVRFALLRPFQLCYEGLAHLLWLIERGVGRVAGVFSRGTENVADRLAASPETVDELGMATSLRSRVFDTLVRSPLRRVGDAAGWLWERIPAPLQRVLAALALGPARLRRALVGGFVLLSEIWFVDVLVRGSIWATQPIWRPIAAVGSFFFAWLITREYRAVLAAAPALLVIVPLAVVVQGGIFAGPQKTSAAYRQEAKAALEAGDYERLEFCERKLAQLGVSDRWAEYRAAEALAKAGDVDEAYERMQELGPVDRPGFSQAHHWILTQLFRASIDVSPDEALRLKGVHLDHLDSLGVRDARLQMMRAAWLLESGEKIAAADALLELAEAMPAAAAECLQINMELHREAEARAAAVAIRGHMENGLRRSLDLTSRDFEAWCVAESVLGDDGRLDAALQQWYDREPENLRVRQALSKRKLEEFKRTMSDALVDDEGLLSKLSRTDAGHLADDFLTSLELDSSDPARFKATLKAVLLKSQLHAVAAEVIEELMGDERTPAAFLETMGSDAVSRGKWDRGKRLLAKAVESEPELAVAWNNLAWTLANKPMPDLDAALQASERALELSPEEFRYRETRGQILVRLGRWNAAVSDLEFAANGMPESPKIHSSLSRAYEALGEHERASMHRQEIR